MTDPKREEWPALIQRLERHYLHIEIGAECGRSESWVGLLKRGIIVEPTHSVGEMLKAMDRDLAQRLAVQPQNIPASVSRETQHPQVENSG